MRRLAAKSRATPSAPATEANKAAAVAGLAPPPPSQAARPTNATADVATDADIEKQAAFNEVLETLRNAGADLTSPVGNRPPSMIFNGQDGSITITDPGVVTPPGAEPARIPDDNRNLAAEHASLVKIVSDMQARLDAGRFDPKTGNFQPVIAGEAREQLQRQLSRTKESVSLSIEALKAIDAQRKSDALKLAAKSNEQLVRAAVGDAAKQAVLADLIQEEELRALARSIVKARAVGRR